MVSCKTIQTPNSFLQECYDKAMKLLFGLVCILSLVAIEGTVSAQQIGGMGQENLLQPGSNSLQQSPGGLQGSTPTVFGGGTGSVLDKEPQVLKISNMTIPVSGTTSPTNSTEQADKGSSLWIIIAVLISFGVLTLWWRKSRV